MKPVKCILFLFTALILIAFSGTAALCADTPESSPWKSEAELGYLLTSGNTETQTANAKLNVIRDSESWKHQFGASGVYSSEKSSATGKGTATAQKYRLSGQSNYKFDDKNAVFGLLTYENDRFSGYKYQLSFAAGYSRQILKTDTLDLSAELGPGYRINKLEDGSTSDIDETEMVGHAAGFFAWKLSKTATFTQTISVDAGSQSVITRSVTALKSQINGHLAMKASYTVKNTSKVPAGTEKTDTETALTLVFSF
ncbi:MAG: DUF481 domain-containing protein [Deltaproteobacteria bacterium]|nr:DUF481 domain-containing protein [Deltaproteobacteria bacterium]